MEFRLRVPRIPGLLLACCATGCSAPDPEQSAPRPGDPWSDQAEVLYQTREVIRYLDARQALELERLRALGVAGEQAPAGQGEPPGQQHQADGQPIAPAYEGS